MRPAAAFTALAVLVAALPFASGCDDPPPSAVPSKSAIPAAPPPPAGSSSAAPIAPAGSSSAAPAPAGSASAAANPSMPPRPIPIGSSGPIQPSAPAEQQMMAINYTLAMVSLQGGDALVDKAYADDLMKKLEVAVRAADKGKTPANPVHTAKGGRKIEIEMGKGCTDRVPLGLLKGRGTSLKEALNAGVLVVSCHDDKWECHQSTRNEADVLCHAAPRR